MSSSSNVSPLPSTFKGLFCAAAGQPLASKDVAMPDAIPGTVIVRVLSFIAEKIMSNLLAGGTGLHSPFPFVPGGRAIGRIAAIGTDTTTLQAGQLVLIDPFVLGRDNPDVKIMWGAGVFGSEPQPIKLITDSWRDGVFAEYSRAPLENCYALNEKLLLGSPTDGGFGYSVGDLAVLPRHAVAIGGLRSINLQPGETIIVAPATGIFSGACVEIASAMGAHVIAVGRNLKALETIAAANPRVDIIQLKGDAKEDLASLQKFGQIDAYIDISPPFANESTHVRTCMMALKRYNARVSLMGFIQKDIPLPYMMAVGKNITIVGKYMYEREDVRALIRLTETGLLKLGKSGGREILAKFTLDDFEKAFELAQQTNDASKIVLIEP
ncbi:hypothetical protein G7Y89_g8615 [Cudoniella acicularis]|uniref:Alcohol dehydrogenase n=1 Tax=Cudoniella acicularis TaxID=354080 RepID=A0A8H4W2Q3_9HELO|nr:hypothetical protein G7Y89_g8615 [Cudoniella acicularis]